MWDLPFHTEPLQWWHVGSRAWAPVTVPGLGCSTACGILVPQLGIKPETPAMQGGFLTTGLPGKSRILNCFSILYIMTIPVRGEVQQMGAEREQAAY